MDTADSADLARKPFGQLMKELTVPQIWAICGAVALLIGTSFGLGYKVAEFAVGGKEKEYEELKLCSTNESHSAW